MYFKVVLKGVAITQNLAFENFIMKKNLGLERGDL